MHDTPRNSQRSKDRPRRRATPQADLNWAIATEFAYMRKGTWLPLLVEFDKSAAPRGSAFEQWQWFVGLSWLPRQLQKSVTVPALFHDLPKRLFGEAPVTVCVVLVAMDTVGELARDKQWNATILGVELGPPLPLDPGSAESLAWAVEPTAAVGSVQRVLMGVIDQGIAFAHQRFRNSTGTRIEWVWQQDVASIPISKAAIDAAINTANGDDEAVYRAVGQLQFSADGYKPLARRRSHGTQVLDLMAGCDPSLNRTDRPIIGVDMPEDAVGDPASSKLTPYALVGLLFILERATALRRPNETLPVVVNLSYGPHDGPHDGRSLFEVISDLLVDLFRNSATPLTLVLAGGNFRQQRAHAEATVAAGMSLRLSWRLQPDSRVPSSTKIWIDGAASNEVKVTLRSPTGQNISVTSAAPKKQLPPTGSPMMSAEYETKGERDCVSLYVSPTERDLESSVPHPVVAHGVWSIVVQNRSTVPVDVHAWVRRGDTQPGRRLKGRQSRLEAQDYARFAANGRPLDFDGQNAPSEIRRQCTLSGIATGAHAFVITGYQRSNAFPARYSSQGPDLNGNRASRAPDWAAPSDDSDSCRGVLAAGNRSGAVAAVGGTSAAAPQSARWLADLWVTQGKHPVPPPGSFQPPAKLPDRPISAADESAAVGKGLLVTAAYCPPALAKLPRP